MSQIRSKIHKGGDPCESDWPSQFGTGEKGVFTFGDVYKPKIYGKAPIAIMDSMPKTYHEAACRNVESRKEWERLDKETGSITFSSQKEAEKITKERLKDEKKALKADRRKASSTALQMHRENPKEMKDKIARQGEKQLETAKKAGFKTELTKLLKKVK